MSRPHAEDETKVVVPPNRPFDPPLSHDPTTDLAPFVGFGPPPGLSALLPGYRLVEPLRVSSGEADLFLLTREADGVRFVLKLYRFGMAPKPEILEAVRRLPPGCAVDVFQIGKLGGRLFEIQEFAEHGSLADVAAGRSVPAPTVRAILAQITRALGCMHAENILHRDVKPSNLLVRSRHPLQLVFTDFGISSLAESSLHITSTNRTISYGAPETIAGVISKASDWWAVGIILLELLCGEHPFRGMDESRISFQLATRGVAVPETLPAEWQLVLQGLLTRDHTKRWGQSEIHAWLDGRRDLPVHYSLQPAAAELRVRPYRFRGQDFSDPTELAVALAQHWSEAVVHSEEGYLRKWVEDNLNDQSLAAHLSDIEADRSLDRDLRLSASLMALSHRAPLFFKGEVVSLPWMSENPRDAADFLQSPLPSWLARLRNDRSLLDFQQRCRHILAELASWNAPTELAHAVPLLLADRRQLLAQWHERAPRFVSASDPFTHSLLRQQELADTELIHLLLQPDFAFQTADQIQERERRQIRSLLEGYGLDLDWTLAEQLAARVDWDRVSDLCNARRDPAQTSAHPLIAALLKDADLPYLDAVVLATAAPTYFSPRRANSRLFPAFFAQTPSPNALATLSLGHRPLRALALDFASQRAFAANSDGTLVSVRIPDQAIVAEFQGHSLAINALAFSHATQLLASAGGGPLDNRIRLWSPSQPDPILELEGPSTATRALAWSPGGDWIAAAGDDPFLHLWDAASGRLIAKVPTPSHPTVFAAFSPEGRCLFAADRSGQGSVWHLESGSPLIQFRVPGSLLHAWTSADGGSFHALAALPSGQPATRHTWTLATAAPQPPVSLTPLHPHTIVALPPHNRWFVVAASSPTIQILNPGGTLIAALPEHPAPVSALALSACGTTLLSGSEDGTFVAWDLAPLLRPGL